MMYNRYIPDAAGVYHPTRVGAGPPRAGPPPLPAFLPANLFLYFPVRFYIIGALSFRKGSGA